MKALEKAMEKVKRGIRAGYVTKPIERYSKGNCPHLDWYNVGPRRVRCKDCGAYGQWGRDPNEPGKQDISW